MGLLFYSLLDLKFQDIMDYPKMLASSKACFFLLLVSRESKNSLLQGVCLPFKHGRILSSISKQFKYRFFGGKHLGQQQVQEVSKTFFNCSKYGVILNTKKKKRKNAVLLHFQNYFFNVLIQNKSLLMLFLIWVAQCLQSPA